MKLKPTYLFVLALLILASCTKRKHVELPSMVENMLTSMDEDMQFNINPNKKDLPLNIRKICQVLNRDTLNILEYDQNKNLLFKYYKQYEGENWNDKYIYMLEANVYKDGRLVKTYTLHSNAGYELYLYGYDGDNMAEVENYHLDNIKGVNINQYSFIKKIKDYKSCMAFLGKLNIEGKGKPQFHTYRDFSDTEVREYGEEDDSYELYSLNDKSQVIKIERYTGGKKWNTSWFFRYNNQQKLAMAYAMHRKDTIEYTKYRYQGQTTTTTKRVIGEVTTTKTYFRDKLTHAYFESENNATSRIDNYTLDRYGIPVRKTESNGDKSMLYQFSNHYEFYK